MEVLDFEKLKTGLHTTLLSRIDLEKLSSVDDGKARPVQRLLGKPVQLVLRARGGFGNAHL